MPFGEMTITLHDTEFLLGIPAAGHPVVPKCEGNTAETLKILGATIGILDEAELKDRIGWHGSLTKQALMRKVAEEPGIPHSRLARLYLWWLVTSTCSWLRERHMVMISFIELLKKLSEASQYAWGAATLANLYRELGIASHRDCKQVMGCFTLLQSWIYAYFSLLRPQTRRS